MGWRWRRKQSFWVRRATILLGFVPVAVVVVSLLEMAFLLRFFLPR
jgi:hypothetical protein